MFHLPFKGNSLRRRHRAPKHMLLASYAGEVRRSSPRAHPICHFPHPRCPFQPTRLQSPPQVPAYVINMKSLCAVGCQRRPSICCLSPPSRRTMHVCISGHIRDRIRPGDGWTALGIVLSSDERRIQRTAALPAARTWTSAPLRSRSLIRPVPHVHAAVCRADPGVTPCLLTTRSALFSRTMACLFIGDAAKMALRRTRRLDQKAVLPGGQIDVGAVIDQGANPTSQPGSFT